MWDFTNSSMELSFELLPLVSALTDSKLSGYTLEGLSLTPVIFGDGSNIMELTQVLLVLALI